MLGDPPGADQARRLQPVGAGHHDVEEDDRDGAVLQEDVPERLVGPTGAEQPSATLAHDGREHGLEGADVLGTVVDEQHGDAGRPG